MAGWITIRVRSLGSIETTGEPARPPEMKQLPALFVDRLKAALGDWRDALPDEVRSTLMRRFYDSPLYIRCVFPGDEVWAQIHCIDVDTRELTPVFGAPIADLGYRLDTVEGIVEVDDGLAY